MTFQHNRSSVARAQQAKHVDSRTMSAAAVHIVVATCASTPAELPISFSIHTWRCQGSVGALACPTAFSSTDDIALSCPSSKVQREIDRCTQLDQKLYEAAVKHFNKVGTTVGTRAIVQ